MSTRVTSHFTSSAFIAILQGQHITLPPQKKELISCITARKTAYTP
jgi:hypothetical protein